MNSELAIMGVTFATVSAALAAIGMLVRDLFSSRVEARRRLELAPEEPKGSLNLAFFRLVEESGVSFSMGTALLIVMGAAIAGGGIPLVFTENLLAAAAGMALGTLIPILVFMVIRWWRVRSMMHVLPQALQAVADCVRSGQTLSETMELVSKEIKGPLGSEFAYAHSQLELGHSPISVMNRMVRRIPIAEFRIFATAVIVHRRAGGNLSLLTERMSHAARDRQDVRSHLMAVTSGSRLSAIGMVAGSIIAVALIAWLEPVYIKPFLEHPTGPYLIAGAVGLQVLGGLWVWRILKSSY
jgi:tight adherence protein B